MKTFLLSALAAICSIAGLSQSYTARIEVNTDANLTPGTIETMTVRITNTSKSAFDISRGSDFTVQIKYLESTSEGTVFNHSLKMPKTLPAGQTYTFRSVSFKAPVLPGNYPVSFTLLWGKRAISEVDRVIYQVAANYEATISAKTLTLPADPDTDLQFKVTNSGNTGWPEGRYSFKFELRRAPSGATSTDKNRFNISPRVIETWDFLPGNSDEIVFRDFQLPRVTGDYTVRVKLQLNGKDFDAEGASRDFTFKIR